MFSPEIALGKMPLFIVVPVYPIKGGECNIIYTLALMLVTYTCFFVMVKANIKEVISTSNLS